MKDDLFYKAIELHSKVNEAIDNEGFYDGSVDDFPITFWKDDNLGTSDLIVLIGCWLGGADVTATTGNPPNEILDYKASIRNIGTWTFTISPNMGLDSWKFEEVLPREKFKCPRCHKDIEKVILVSECDQFATPVVKDGPIQLKDIQSVHAIGETLKVLCPLCTKDMSRYHEFREVY